jgi:decaprenylphospho-beta-D-ribofuranose 2-oxidase
VESLYASLCAITLHAGGRVYLAKDALLSPQDFRRMYPEFPDFRAVLRDVDPNARLQSGMARRLRLHDA